MLNDENDIKKRVTVILGPGGIGKTRELIAEKKRQESFGNYVVFIQKVCNSCKEFDLIRMQNCLLQITHEMNKPPLPEDPKAEKWRLVFLIDDCHEYDGEVLKRIYDYAKDNPDVFLILAGRNELENKIKNYNIKANYKIIT